VQTFRARVVDLGPESVIVETTGTQEKLDGLIEILRPFGIIELVRTGAVAMLRGPETAPKARHPNRTTEWRHDSQPRGKSDADRWNRGPGNRL